MVMVYPRVRVALRIKRLQNPSCAFQSGSARREFPRHDFRYLLRQHSTAELAFPNRPGRRLPAQTISEPVECVPFALEAQHCAFPQGVCLAVQRLQEFQHPPRGLPKEGGLSDRVQPRCQQFQSASARLGKPRHIPSQPGRALRSGRQRESPPRRWEWALANPRQSLRS